MWSANSCDTFGVGGAWLQAMRKTSDRVLGLCNWLRGQHEAVFQQRNHNEASFITNKTELIKNSQRTIDLIHNNGNITNDVILRHTLVPKSRYWCCVRCIAVNTRGRHTWTVINTSRMHTDNVNIFQWCRLKLLSKFSPSYRWHFKNTINRRSHWSMYTW